MEFPQRAALRLRLLTLIADLSADAAAENNVLARRYAVECIAALREQLAYIESLGDRPIFE